MNETITKNCTSVQEDWSLASLLGGCKKNRIKTVAASYEVKVSDKLTKPQMVEAVLPVIEVSFGIKLKQYSQQDMKVLLGCIAQSVIDEETALLVTESAPFADGAIFLTAKKEKIAAIVPHDLAAKVMTHCTAHCFVSDDDALARTAKACALIYGRFTPELLANAVNAAYEGTGCTAEAAAAFLADASCEEFTYADGKATYALGQPAEQNHLAAKLEYALPTRREVEAYSLYGFDSTDYYYRQMVNFIYNNQTGSYDRANALMKRLSDWCVADGSIYDIFDIVQACDMPLNASQFEFLLDTIGELADRTRRQSLKGHKPDEVEGTRPTVMPRVASREDDAPNRPIRVGQKIGRNDPCPCGSGKKYKKCCGKSSR